MANKSYDDIRNKLLELDKRLEKGGYYECRTFWGDEFERPYIEIMLPFISLFDIKEPFIVYIGFDVNSGHYYLSDLMQLRKNTSKLSDEEFYDILNDSLKRPLAFSAYISTDGLTKDVRIMFDDSCLDNLEVSVTKMIFIMSDVFDKCYELVVKKNGM